MTSEKMIVEEIKKHEEENNIPALETIRNEAKEVADNRIANKAQEALSRLEEKAESTVATSAPQVAQIEAMGGSVDELANRTQEDDQKIKEIGENAENEINQIKTEPEAEKENKIKVDPSSMMSQIKSKFGENYFVDETLQNTHKAEYVQFLAELKNGAANPKVVDETVGKMRDDAIQNLYKQYEPQIKDLARGNPSQSALRDLTERIQGVAGIKVSTTTLNKMLQLANS